MLRYQNTTASFMATSAIVLWIENRENLGRHCAGCRELLVQREGMRSTGTLNRMWDMSYKQQNCQLESCTVAVLIEGRDRKCAQSGTRLVHSRNHSACSHRRIYTLVIKITRKSVVTMVPRKPSRDLRFLWQLLRRLPSFGTLHFMHVDL
jgi:hypothetical protein